MCEKKFSEIGADEDHKGFCQFGGRLFHIFLFYEVQTVEMLVLCKILPYFSG